MKDELADRIRLGDEQAFELFFHKYYVRLCGFANKFLNNPEDAKEVVQEVLIGIWENRDVIDPEESLQSYVFKITQNKSINKLRHKKVETKYIDIYKLVYCEHDTSSHSDTLLAKELDFCIRKAIELLPPQCKRVFELSRIEGLSYKEIAAFLHISIKTVEGQISKALQILRNALVDYL